MRGEYFIVGAIFVVVGIFLLAKGFSKSDGKSAMRGGAVGFLGPIPFFGFASNKKMLYLLLGAGLLLFLIFRLLQLLKNSNS